MAKRTRRPRCIVIAGPNGAGKTTFARRYLPTKATGARAVKATTRSKKPESFAAGVGRALRLAAKDARKTARMYGTPIYVWENGKVVAKKP